MARFRSGVGFASMHFARSFVASPSVHVEESEHVGDEKEVNESHEREMRGWRCC